MPDYDAIVVGARVAGAPTAMLLARKGYRVLLVDRATFPSDTMSTHLVHPPGMAALERWGLASGVIATGCPPVTGYRLDLGDLVLSAAPRGLPGAPCAYGPRRLVLDGLLVEAAARDGAEVRQSFTVEDLLFEEGKVVGLRGHSRGGAPVEERARVVIGADGEHSVVARRVEAEKYNEVPATEALYYAYWSGVPVSEFELCVREDRGYACLPTHDGLTVMIVAWPVAEFATNRTDVEGNYERALQSEPVYRDRLSKGRRESRIAGTLMENFYRQSYGPGWALAGDAGYHKDACTAQGISDAFRDAESLAEALDEVFSGRQSYEGALAAYQEARDRATLPMFELTCQFASFDPPAPETLELFAALNGNPQGVEDFMSMLAGTMPVQAFFEPSNLAGYLGEAGRA